MKKSTKELLESWKQNEGERGEVINSFENTASSSLRYDAQFEGEGESGRFFHYWATVFPQARMEILVESFDQSPDGLDQIVRELLAGARFTPDP